MMSGLDIVALIAVGGVVAGGAWDRIKGLGADRREERARLANGPEPVCGCGHHLAYHDLHDFRCYAEVKREAAGGAGASGTSSNSKPDTEGGSGAEPGTAASWHQCACRRYAGPEPLATLYAPPIARAGYQASGRNPADVLDELEAIEAAETKKSEGI